MKLGITELAIVAVLVVVVFGARAIPRLARAMGSIGGEFHAGRKSGIED